MNMHERIMKGKHIILGEGTYINFNCNFVDDGMITVGKGCLFD